MSAKDNIDTLYVSTTGRKTYFLKELDDYTKHGVVARKSPEPALLEKANLVSSEVEDGMHMPVIDCDYQIAAVPSTQIGHYHLYIDKALTWDQYKALLDGFMHAGLIEVAWYRNAIQEKRSFVRLPHVTKPRDQREQHVLPF